MNIIIDWEKYETTFENDKIVVMLKKLTREAFLLIIPELKKLNEAEKLDAEEKREKGGDPTSAFEAGLNMQGVSQKILEQFMIWKEGFTVNGELPTVDILCNYSMFSSLIIDIMGELIVRSTMSEAEIKN